MRLFGLIGYPLGHSWSARYFHDKFAREGIAGCRYDTFPLSDIDELDRLVTDHPSLEGVNVTIPHKISVLQKLAYIHPDAEQIGAVNCIRIVRTGGKTELRGYNTDADGFRESFLPLTQGFHSGALILGSGGASRAVQAVLTGLGIEFLVVSRNPESPEVIHYDQLDRNVMDRHRLIINCTPLGMHPAAGTLPPIPYEYLHPHHILYDLVYNPAETLFMKKGREAGATARNGLEMLQIQAERSWDIWNDPSR